MAKIIKKYLIKLRRRFYFKISRSKYFPHQGYENLFHTQNHCISKEPLILICENSCQIPNPFFKTVKSYDISTSMQADIVSGNMIPFLHDCKTNTAIFEGINIPL